MGVLAEAVAALALAGAATAGAGSLAQPPGDGPDKKGPAGFEKKSAAQPGDKKGTGGPFGPMGGGGGPQPGPGSGSSRRSPGRVGRSRRWGLAPVASGRTRRSTGG